MVVIAKMSVYPVFNYKNYRKNKKFIINLTFYHKIKEKIPHKELSNYTRLINELVSTVICSPNFGLLLLLLDEYEKLGLNISYKHLKILETLKFDELNKSLQRIKSIPKGTC